jgi:signal transduction histidine kinase
MTATLLSLFLEGFKLIPPQELQVANKMLVNLPSLLFFIEGLIISLTSGARNDFEEERNQILLNEKLARRNAEQQARIRAHFISVASHELKSPITSQKAYLQLLKKSIKGNNLGVYNSYLNKIEAQTDKLTNFINDLLDVSKMTSRKLQYNFTLFDMKSCVQEAIENIHSLLITHKVQIKGNIERKVYGDKDRIYQVITNLLSNAIKYSPEANIIVVSLSEDNHDINVSVQDYGIGINPANLDKIFNRFFRVTESDESHFKGLGLGLYLSAEIIKKHNGKIWVESIERKGSTFYFTLPIKHH